MDLQQLANELSALGDGYVLVSVPDQLDITSRKPFTIKIASKEKELDIKITPMNCSIVLRYLVVSVLKPGRLVICWDIKSLFSYHLFHTNKIFKIWGKPLSHPIGGGAKLKEPILFDLKIVERYVGKENNRPPKSWAEATNRLKDTYPVMKQFNDVYDETPIHIYKSVHSPLINRVIPHLETAGIVLRYEKLYAHYDIEGQINGRLKCEKVFERGYVPHVIKPEDRGQYCPPNYGNLFIYLDYRSFEVRVLQWLSGDEALGEIINSGEEIYTGIIRKITGKNIKDAKDMGKKLFLPVVFGAGSRAIADSLKISEENAGKLINILTRTFPKAMSYPNEMQQSVDKNGMLRDHFGRCRIFNLDKLYLARNFCVQSPAATISQAKLIDLYRVLNKENMGNLGFYIHDGYGIFCKKSESDQVLKIAKEALESENKLFPGLKLKTSCYIGENLNELEITDVG